MHHLVHLRSPHPRERLGTQPADPMLAGRSAMETVEHRIIELLPQGEHPLKIGRVRRVEQRPVMGVPITDVSVDPGDGRMPLSQADEKLDELRDPVPRDDRILHEAPRLAGSGTLDDRRKYRSAELPESGLRVRILGDLRGARSEEHTSELQSLTNLVCRLLLEKK